MSKTTTETTTKTPAAVLVEAATTKPAMDALAAALAAAERNASAGRKAPKPVAGVTPSTWALLSKDGPFAKGTATDGHRRFIKGLIPRLPESDRAQVEALVKHYAVKL